MGKSLARLIVVGLLVAACSSQEADTSAEPSPQAEGDVAVETFGEASTSDGASTPTSASPPSPVTLAVVGDIMLTRGVGDRMEREGTEAVLAGVGEDLIDADVTIGNVESPVGQGGDPANKRYTFLAEADAIDVLTDGGFDVVSLANNHILDRGVIGMQSTQELLDQAGIKHAGAGADESAARAPVIVETQGMRIAFLSYLNTESERGGFETEAWTAGPDQPGGGRGETRSG